MNQNKTKITPKKLKIDPFHLVLILSTIMGLVSIIFIISTAKPRPIKIVRWSAVSSSQEALEALSKIQYGELKQTHALITSGLKSLKLGPYNLAAAIEKVTHIHVKENSTNPHHLLLNSKKKKDLYLVFNNKVIANTKEIAVENFYDPKELKKQLTKNNLKSSTPILFTAYKLTTDKINIDFIQLQSSQ